MQAYWMRCEVPAITGFDKNGRPFVSAIARCLFRYAIPDPNDINSVSVERTVRAYVVSELPTVFSVDIEDGKIPISAGAFRIAEYKDRRLAISLRPGSSKHHWTLGRETPTRMEFMLAVILQGRAHNESQPELEYIVWRVTDLFNRTHNREIP